MLIELRVRNLGVIEDLTLQVGPGMTALTGETGAGKTLLVEALQLVLGGRAAPGLVRAGADEALVEARFATGRDVDREGDADRDDDEVVLARAVPTGGRSRAWVDGRMAPVATLSELGDGLVEIHGQHDQQSLLSAAAQRRALDGFAGADVEPLAAARRALAEVERRLAGIGGDEHRRARDAEVLRHQLDEIDRAALAGPDEDAALAAEEERLADLAAHRDAAARALGALDGDELLGEAVGALAGRAPFAAAEARLRAVVAEVGDVAADLRTAVDTWEDDPARLAEVQARRRLLADLRRKYGDDVAGYAEDARRQLAELDGTAAAAAELEERRGQARAEVAAAEAALRKVREDAAPRLAAAAGNRLRALAMPDARFEVAVDDQGARFLLTANRGEPPQPLAKVASGGELARAMLALRLVASGGPGTMLFDEVDAGVGGSAALALGSALHEVAGDRQVLVVTHLAQVAAFADRQVAVRKEVRDGRTVTTATALSHDDRVVELSRMLSGHPDSPTARAHAEELLGRSTAVAGSAE
ncbi:MAG TPA: DNA repair protein RecN [Acidimicrobiales bacterium]|nr:DNA repair protein RecN [Acidimicrobiales bacterium]